MWYVSGDAEKSWGANLAGVPAMSGYVPQDRMTVFLVLVNHWSDGTPATH
jgi:D-alanyl-D-alanine carboxypeptidase